VGFGWDSGETAGASKEGFSFDTTQLKASQYLSDFSLKKMIDENPDYRAYRGLWQGFELP
jgi:phage terminase small subunit